MAPRAVSKPSSASARQVNNIINNYDVDDDPFAESGDEAPNNTAQSKKQKDATGLGIDEAIAIQRKPRVPTVKLDEARLLSEKGIPRLRRKARDLKFKGKGHEFSDAARLLSFYQLWFDDLFPKAKFLDAAAMAEKAGHKKYMRLKRLEWIDEGKPKLASIEDGEDPFGESSNQLEERAAAVFPARVAPIFQNRENERPQTPARDDVPDDDDMDIYDATPLAPRKTQPASTSLFGGGESNTTSAGASIFGNGAEPDEDDLDALMAEEEAQRTKQTSSLFGSGDGKANQLHNEPDEDDLDAFMAEVEAQPKASTASSKPTRNAVGQDEGDDLDALMAEVDDLGQTKRPGVAASSMSKETTDKPQNVADMDEEEAMAEMDGLW
ncbi:Swi3-domain-containing protein [Hypoxylon sp. NC1633]|nr:Swi3-domain-containing protein [Hypoxylon sp. NC1633]